MLTSNQQTLFFLLISLFIAISSLATFSQGRQHSTGPKFKLIHHHHHPKYPLNRTQLDRLRHSAHGDAARLSAISHHKRGRKAKDDKVSGEMPIRSAADSGIAQYFVQLKVGSPAQKFALIADTGSDLTWVNCNYRCRSYKCRRNSNKNRIFAPYRSSSFRTVPCSSRMCKVDLASLFSLVTCPSPRSPCAYDYSYADRSAALGVFAKETVTFSLTNRRKTKLHDVLIGCTNSTRGQSFQAADGVMGLAYSNFSFAVKAANKFGGKFSYCLVDHLSPKNVSSYLMFGSHNETASSLSKMRYTELVLDAIIPFYAVNMKGITVGDEILRIPNQVWDVNGVGGVILDSGTSLTSLAQPAYRHVMAALQRSLSNFTKLDLDIGPLEYCFNSTGFNEALMPRLVFHFANGARFDPPVKSYLIDADVGVKCIGIVAGAWPGESVIGNIMQQNHLWEFDLKNKRLGFASSSCT